MLQSTICSLRHDLPLVSTHATNSGTVLFPTRSMRRSEEHHRCQPGRSGRRVPSRRSVRSPISLLQWIQPAAAGLHPGPAVWAFVVPGHLCRCGSSLSLSFTPCVDPVILLWPARVQSVGFEGGMRCILVLNQKQLQRNHAVIFPGFAQFRTEIHAESHGVDNQHFPVDAFKQSPASHLECSTHQATKSFDG